LNQLNATTFCSIVATSYLRSFRFLSLPPFIFFSFGLGKRVRRAPKTSQLGNEMILVKKKEAPYGKGKEKNVYFF
jgi:hypothetical protein